MYLEHYGLAEPPFSITPDPRFVYLSERHRDALAHLLFGIGQGGGGGFVQLTGEVGTGKTTLCRLLLEQLPENTRVALVLNPRLSPVELLETICEELRIPLDGRRGSLKALVDALNAYLLQAYADGLRVVLIIDEAQNLSVEALEQVRLLTNLETDTQKLLQIVLLGQPELRELLAREDLRQLAQRITARFHLTPLDAGEIDHYLRHRFAVAGGQRFPFTKLAVKRIHQHSGGVPRLANIIAERALLAGYAHDEAQIGERWVDRAAREALAPRLSRLPRPDAAHVVGAAIVLAALAFWLWPERPAPAPIAAPAAAPAVAVVEDVVPYLPGDALGQRIALAGDGAQPAWRQLLGLWTVRAQEAAVADASRCPPVIAPGIYCLRGRASLDKLAALGRPALLRLDGPDGEAWALLLGADGLRVRLWLGGGRFDTDRLALERHWRGDYVSVWRGPGFLSPPPGPGDSGPAVDWIHDRLRDRAGLADADAGPAVFDAASVAAVRRLQTAHGLAADGVVGPETLLALGSGDGDGPRLRRALD
ncbi:MAG TPA: AAA family ATPase [Arenimonas sp.]|uniref:ExeA family protein n=1 Tax=Arenimonas sp. TaxID=1872635 RepID=UPI002D810532|nr:AAA family ATPase [Arenimonas sp.]HEU0152723.1 AAA family ATPase [Arenimonas sp.]